MARDWLAARGIPSHIRRWQGVKPSSRVQETARRIRYDLMTDWCRRHGVLHLLLAHHRLDQAETVLMRDARPMAGSGLAGMAAARPHNGVRLLRPLLDVSRAALEGVLASARQAWLDDPSNDDERFERVRLRRKIASRPCSETRRALVRAASAAKEHENREHEWARFAARHASLHPAGYLHLSHQAWLDAGEELARHGLTHALRCIGGQVHGPRGEKLDALISHLRASQADRGRTLAGCRIVGRGGVIQITREIGRLPPPVAIVMPGHARWDRFDITMQDLPSDTPLECGALGREGTRQVRESARHDVPPAVLPSLPALWREGQVLSAPHIAFTRDDMPQGFRAHARFLPPQPLVGDGLRVV